MRRDFRASRSLYESQSRSMWQFRPGAGGVLMKALRHIMTYIRRNTHIYIILCIYVNKIIPLSLSLSLSRSFYWSIDLLIHWTIDLLIYWSIYLSIYPSKFFGSDLHSFTLQWRNHFRFGSLWLLKKMLWTHHFIHTSPVNFPTVITNAEKCLEQKRNLLTNMEPTWDDLALLHVLWHSILKFGWNATHGPTKSIASYQFHCVFVTFINVYQRVNVWNPTTHLDTRLLRSVTPAKVSFTALSATISMFLSKERQHYCR